MNDLIRMLEMLVHRERDVELFTCRARTAKRMIAIIQVVLGPHGCRALYIGLFTLPELLEQVISLPNILSGRSLRDAPICAHSA